MRSARAELALLVKGAATQPGLSCQVREKSTSWCSSSVALCSGLSMPSDDLIDLGAVEHRTSSSGRKLPVDPDPWCEPLARSRSEPWRSQRTWSQGSIRSL